MRNVIQDKRIIPIKIRDYNQIGRERKNVRRTFPNAYYG